MPARNTLIQLLSPYTNPESHGAQRHRQTDRRHAYANSRSYCVAVRSAKNSSVRRKAEWTNEAVPDDVEDEAVEKAADGGEEAE